MTYDKPPRHSISQPNNLSLTISKLKEDVHPELLDLLHDYMSNTSIKSGLSIEVGHRAFNLHIQGTFIMKFPCDKKAISDLVGSLSGYSVVLKALAEGQSFTTMLGYITKDADRSIR